MADHLNAGQSDRLHFQIFQNIQKLFHACVIFTDLPWDTAMGLVKKKKIPQDVPSSKRKNNCGDSTHL